MVSGTQFCIENRWKNLRNRWCNFRCQNDMQMFQNCFKMQRGTPTNCKTLKRSLCWEQALTARTRLKKWNFASKFWDTPSLLYRRRCVLPNTYFSALFKIYTLCILLNRSALRNSAKTRPNYWVKRTGRKTAF